MHEKEDTCCVTGDLLLGHILLVYSLVSELLRLTSTPFLMHFEKERN